MINREGDGPEGPSSLREPLEPCLRIVEIDNDLERTDGNGYPKSESSFPVRTYHLLLGRFRFAVSEARRTELPVNPRHFSVNSLEYMNFILNGDYHFRFVIGV